MTEEINPTIAPSAALDHVLRGIQDAVVRCQHLANDQFIRILDFYFDKGPAGELTAKTVKMVVDTPQKGLNADGSFKQSLVTVPLLSLVPVQSLVVSELEVGMQLRLTEVNRRDRDDRHGATDSGTDFQVDIGHTIPSRLGLKDSRMIDVKIKFKSAEAPEGIHRIIEQLNDSITDRIKPTKENGDGGNTGK